MSSRPSLSSADDDSRVQSAYPLAEPDSLDLILPLPPSAGRMPRSSLPLPLALPLQAKEHTPPAQIRSSLPALPALPPRQLCYPSPRLLSDHTSRCSSGDAGGDCRAPVHPAWTGARGGPSELETRSYVADSSCVTAAADSSRKTLISTVATTAPSETGAAPAGPSAPAPGSSCTRAVEDEQAQRNHDSEPAAAGASHDGPGPGTRRDACDGAVVSDPSYPRSPAASTRSSASEAAVANRAHSGLGGRAASLPLPATPSNSYATADEIFDVGQLCRRLSLCSDGETIALSNRILQPPTDSWPLVLHDHGAILPYCGGGDPSDRRDRATCGLRAAQGIVTCMYGVHATVRDAILNVGEGTCLLLDETCGNVVFKDVCFQGGAIVCRGRGCRVTLTRVDLQSCTVIALNGAEVNLSDTSATATPHGVCVFACGEGTCVNAKQITLTDGLLGVTVQGGARFSGSLVTITGAHVAGMHACGVGTYLHIARGHIYDPGTPHGGQRAADGVLLSADAVCLLEDTAVAHAEVGIAILSRSRATLKNCRLHGCTGSSVVVEDGGLEMFDCAMELSGGCGMVLQRGSEAEAHGCAFTRSTLNGVYVQQGSEVILRWCTLEFSAVWSGLEVEGNGSSVECHSCLFLRNKHCGAFVHTGAEADLSACESEGNGMTGYRVHGRDSRLRLDGCCAKDVIAYQTHHSGRLECNACSPGGDIMAEALDGVCALSGTDELAPVGNRGPSEDPGSGKRQKRSFFKALVRAFDRRVPQPQ